MNFRISLEINVRFSSILPQMVTRTKKIFVGGLSAPTTLEDVKNYFEQFGPVSKKHLWNYSVAYLTAHRVKLDSSDCAECLFLYSSHRQK